MILILKIILFTFIFLIGCVILYVFAAIIGALISVNNGYKPPTNGIEIFLISNGVHTDICIPVNKTTINWDEIIDFTSFERRVQPTDYISFGWGDKGFYLDTPTWGELKFSTAFTAGFLSAPTLFHITMYNQQPQHGKRIKSVIISKKQLEIIENYLKDSFQLKKEKALLVDCESYTGVDDNFYEAKGSYSISNTCNSWVNRALKKAGLKTAIWAPLDKCILYHF